MNDSCGINVGLMWDTCQMCLCAGRRPGQSAGGRTVVGNSGFRRVGGLVLSFLH